jgi:hypothetical protein
MVRQDERADRIEGRLRRQQSKSTGGFTMRKTTGLFAIAPVLILAGAGGWASSNTRAPIATPTEVRIDLSEVAMNANQLPAQHYQDFSVIFH